MKVQERFLKYVRFETTSNEASSSVPSTPNQLILGAELVKELLEMGILDAHMDDNGYIMATIPANTDKPIPTIGFIAHMDTAPDMTTHGISPQVIHQYDGHDIILNKEQSIVTSPKDFPALKKYIGQDLIVTNGLTLLGADDKAGIASIMTMVEYLMTYPDFLHGPIKIGFTPDEEIGRGADHFDVKAFGADFAYTVDGGELGELEFESFNAANGKVTINGRNVHPGYAKNEMINALELAMELHQLLPHAEKPQYTTKYEGFFHLNNMNGSVEKAEMVYIVRDHDRDLFEQRKALFHNAVEFMNKKYGKDTVILQLKDVYYNMGEVIAKSMDIVNIAKEAFIQCGIKPIIKPIRGGTDGSRLSFMGLPCPNLFAGGHNFHGKHEFIPIQSMEKSVESLLKIIELYTSK